MSVADNLQIALEEQQKSNALNKSQQSDVDAKKEGSQKKTKAAMFSQLDDLTMTLLAKDEAVKEQQKANTLDKSQQSDVGAKKKGNQKKKKASMFDLIEKGPDSLVALVLAGITIQEKTNALNKSQQFDVYVKKEGSQKKTKAARCSQLEDLTMRLLVIKESASQCADKQALKDQKSLNKSRLGGASPTNDSDDEKKSSNADKTTAPTPTTKKPSMFDLIVEKPDPLIALVLAGITIQEKTNEMITSLSTSGDEISKATTKAAKSGNDWMNNFYSCGGTAGNPGTYDTGSSGIPGATGSGNSAEFSELMGIWQYVQQQVSQINNQFQTVAGLPSTMMQTLTQSISTANSGQSATIQAMGTTTSLVNGWAGV